MTQAQPAIHPQPSAGHPLLRHRDGHHARVRFEELFFSPICAFLIDWQVVSRRQGALRVH